VVRLAGLEALAGEGAEPAGESIRFLKVNKVAVAGPFVDLGRREKTAEMLSFLIAEGVAEDRQKRGRDRRERVIDAALELVRGGGEHFVPVADDEVLADALPSRDARSFRLGQAVQADALTERLKRGVKSPPRRAGASEWTSSANGRT
jgi:hypothetical protein